MTFVFNPEHDLCLANGDSHFVPPASALKFGRDCHDLLETVLGNQEMPEQDRSAEVPYGCKSRYEVLPWGWNNVLKTNLLKAGIPETQLPSDSDIAEIRRLSHRRTALQTGRFIWEALRESGLHGHLTAGLPEEILTPEAAEHFLERHPNAVFKAPWSGSGKGLRWIRRNEFSHSDAGWCRNVIDKQGSIIAEPREEVVCDFAMLFSTSNNGIHFEGYSLFDTDNGAYRSNILASDRYILAHLSRFIPENVLTAVRRQLTTYLKDNFTGRYKGYLGVDMFICRTNGESGDYLLNPCVEINVRMTMGLLARKYFDRHLSKDIIPGQAGSHSHADFRDKDAESTKEKPGIDGRYRLTVFYAPDPATLRLQLDSAVTILTGITEDTRYAVAISGASPILPFSGHTYQPDPR